MIDKNSTISQETVQDTKGSFITISAEGKITDINEASVQNIGIERDAIIGTSFSDHFVEQVQVKKEWKHVFEKGFIENYPFTIKHKNGKLKDVIYSASIYKDEEGVSHGFFTEATDSIAHKLAAQYSHSLIEASLDPLITIDSEGKIMDMNEALINVTGYSRKELNGSHFVDYFTDKKKARDVYNYVFKNNAIEDFALTLQHKDGTLIDVLFNGAVYKDPLGKVQGVVVVARTIDRQKWALDLQIANKKVAIQNRDNKKKATALAIAKKELDFQNKEKQKQAKELAAVNKKLTRESKEREKIAAKLIEANKKLTFQNREKENKASELLIANNELAVQIDENEKHAIELAKVNKELASRSKEKEKWKTVSKELKELNITATLDSQYNLSLIEASRDPLVTINTAGKITDMNEAFVNSTGLIRTILTNSDFCNYFKEKQKAQEVHHQIFATGSINDAPLTLIHKNGKQTDVLFNGSVYKNEDGKVAGVVLVARDITEQKRIASELIEAKNLAEFAKELAEEAKVAAENAVQAKQQFLSNMSHEIRTPMNAIIGFTKVVLKTDLTVKQKEYLEAIKMSGDAMIVLINDILDLAKVESGQMSFEQVAFKLRSSVSSMLHLFEPKIHEKNLKLVKEFDPDIPELLVGDPMRLHQIILNLVSNAVKFTSSGKIIVSVKLLDQDKEKVIIHFAVTDTGIGIPKDRLDSIFENFQQASSHTSRLYGGTGLGLAIVKQLIEPQGGKINVKSIEGFGSTFSFTLPFYKAYTNPEKENNHIETQTEFKNIKVLIVEDIPLNQLLMKTLLDDFGFQHDSAENGAIAVQKLQENKFDVVLMDLQMPVMDGFEATTYIRKTLKSKIPIIALTADVTTVDLEKCRAVGMNDYLAKPVDERILFSKIIEIIEKPYPKIKIKIKRSKKKKVVAKESCIDLTYLKKITKSSPKLMMEMIQLYLTQTPIIIQAIKQNLVSKNWNSVSAAVHRILPSFAIVGINRDYEIIAKKIQELANAEKETTELEELVVKLEHICIQACEELSQELDKIKITI
ncbi:PAS domain S-box-containing protein [Flavobacterium sp. PL11]|uniref:PAS domain-containing hybrid sensor histidine kinase/response regulator n=1 Tax=Flavobacterium sp. PL11 TaxID=3071717 RepID=UPI002E09B4EB|nr:PAS domain S-box-containing protein [Flavobacterium sp. PL11]